MKQGVPCGTPFSPPTFTSLYLLPRESNVTNQGLVMAARRVAAATGMPAAT